MNKFFKDIIGELKSPSEDAEKVLDVIRRVLRVTILLTAVVYLTNLIHTGFYLFNIYKEGYLCDYIKYSERTLFSFVFPYVKSLLRFILYLILFFFSNKSINSGKLIKRNLFFITLILLIALQLTSFKFDLVKIPSSISMLLINICTNCIIYVAFWDKDNRELNSSGMNKKRVQTIANLGYLLLVTTTLSQTIYLPKTLYSYFSYLAQQIKYDIGVSVYDWFTSIAYILQTIVYLSLLMVLILGFVGRRKSLSWIRERAVILIILLIIGMVTLIVGYFILSGSYFYIIVFALAVSYQNKYKVFNDIAKRTFKRTVEAIKTGFNNYLSFK